MNYNVVSERRKWLEIGCSLMTCTTLTNASAISTNTLTDVESSDRGESWGPWKRHSFEKGNGTFHCEERGLCAVHNKMGLL